MVFAKRSLRADSLIASRKVFFGAGDHHPVALMRKLMDAGLWYLIINSTPS